MGKILSNRAVKDMFRKPIHST